VLFDQDESRIDLVSLADGQSVGTILAAGQARFATLAAFSPDDSLKSGQKQILEQFWTSWVSFREYEGLLVYFTHLVSYRCGIAKIEYALDDGPTEEWPLQACDPANPNGIGDGDELYRKINKGTKSMQVRLTYFDGSQSPVRTFKVNF
jgi:hypothetical protein